MLLYYERPPIIQQISNAITLYSGITMNRKKLSEHFKVIKQSVDDFDSPEVALSAVEAIMPAAEQGHAQAQYMLGMYYYTFYCEDSSRFLPWMERAANGGNLKAIKFLSDYFRFICDDIDPEQRKALGQDWLHLMIDVLKKKADKGVISAVKSLMNLYVHDRPDNMTEKEGRQAALMCYERLIGILRAKAENGTAKDKKNLADGAGCERDYAAAMALYRQVAGEKKHEKVFLR